MLLTACLLVTSLLPHQLTKTYGCLASNEDSDAVVALAEALAVHAEARASGDGLDEARLALDTHLAELGATLDGEHPLGHAAFLSRAAWLARGYDRQKVESGVVSTTWPAPGLDGGELELAYRLPKDYDPEEAWPLVLAIPDEDERPRDHLRERWGSSEFREGAILVCPTMPDSLAEWDQIAVKGRPGGLSHALTALRLADERFAVDFDRVFVVGSGKGVPTALAAGDYAPHRFAGVAGRAGDAGELGPGNFLNVPVWLAGAGARAREFQAAAVLDGIEHVELAPAGTEADLWTWLERKRRSAYPDTVQLVVGKPFPTRAHWLRVAPMAPDARALGTIDRDTNTLTLEATGVSSVTLYLNDRLVDLNRPLTVAFGDETLDLGLEPRLDDMLALLADGSSDPGALYTVELWVDLTTGGTEAPPPEPDAAFERRLAECEGDAEALWDLVLWCRSNGRGHETPRVLRRILRIDPALEDARSDLGHVRHDSADGTRWFDSPARLERWLAYRDEAVAAERGLVRVRLGKGEAFIHPDERALAKRAKDKDPHTGQWLDSGDLARLDDDWGRQDLEWIEPEQAHRLDDGLFRIGGRGGEWVDAARADQHHARLDSMWRIPDDRILLRTTLPRRTALQAMEHAGDALDDLRRVFGAEPPLPLEVIMVRDQEQYDRFAFGAPDGRRAASHAARENMIHHAYLAESLFERQAGEAVFRGTGVGYWDVTVPFGDAYGLHAARLAAGLSYVEALDPSPRAVKKAEGDGPDGRYHDAWRAEKQLPDWLRWGGAVHAERWFLDEGATDPLWARTWTKANLEARGGMRALAEVLDGGLDPEDRDHSMHRLLEWGAVVTYMVDGGNAAVDAAHADLKRALAGRRPLKKPLAALVEALLAHEAELVAFSK